MKPSTKTFSFNHFLPLKIGDVKQDEDKLRLSDVI